MDLRTRIIISSKDNTRKGFKSTESGLTALNNKINSVQKNLKNLFVAGIGAGLVQSLLDTADNLSLLDGGLQQATDSEEEFNQVSEELFQISNRTGTELENNVRLYSRISEAVKQAGGSSGDATRLIETFNKSLILGGANAAETASAVLQFAQAMSSGKLAGDEFKSINEASAKTISLLAEGLGFTTGEMKQLAAEGKLTSSELLRGLLNISDKVDSLSSALPESIRKAITQIRNEWNKFLNDLNKTTGITVNIAEGLQVFAKNFQSIASAATKLGSVLLAVVVASLVKSTAAFVANTVQVKINAAAEVALAKAKLLRAKAEVKATAAMLAANPALAASATVRATVIAQQKAYTAAVAGSTTATTAAAGAMGVLTSALNGLLVGFIAFKIGEFLVEEFLIARIALTFLIEAAVKLGSVLSDLANFNFANIGANLDALSEKFENARLVLYGEDQARKDKAEVADFAAAASAEFNDAFSDTAISSSLSEAFSNATAQIDAAGAAQTETAKQRQIAATNEVQNHLIASLDLRRQIEEQNIQASELSERAKISRIDALNDLVAQKKQNIQNKINDLFNRGAVAAQAADNKIIASANRAANARIAASLRAEQGIISNLAQTGDAYQAVNRATELIEQALSQARQARAANDFATEKQFNDKAIALMNDRLTLAREIDKQTEAGFGIGVLEVFGDKVKQVGTDVAALEQELTDLTSANQNLGNVSTNAADKVTESTKETAQGFAQTGEEVKKVSKDVDDLGEKKPVTVHDVNSNIKQVIDEVLSLDGTTTRSTHVIDVVRNQGNALNKGGPVIKFASGGSVAERIRQFAAGGFNRIKEKVPGVGNTDTVKALLTPGEFVIKKSSVQRVGLQTLEKINQDGALPEKKNRGGFISNTVQHFATGGIVGDRIRQFITGGSVSSAGPTTDSSSMSSEQNNTVNNQLPASVRQIFNSENTRVNNQLNNVRSDGNRVDNKINNVINSVAENVRQVKQTLLSNVNETSNPVADNIPSAIRQIFPTQAGLNHNQVINTLSENIQNFKQSPLVSQPIVFNAPGFPAVGFEPRPLINGRAENEQKRNDGGIINKTIQYFSAGGGVGEKIRHFAAGGFNRIKEKVPGVGNTDTVKALLTPGEFVIKKDSVSQIGIPMLERINQEGRLPQKKNLGGRINRIANQFSSGGSVGEKVRRFATGGLVENVVQRFASGGTVSRAPSTVGSIFSQGQIDSALTSQVTDAHSSLLLFMRQVKEGIKSSGAQLDLELSEADQKFNQQIAQSEVQYKSSIDAIEDRFKTIFDAAAQNFKKVTKQIESDKKSFARSIDASIRAITRAGLTEEEVYVDKVKEIREKQAEAQEALANGDIETAQRLNQEIVGIANDISGELKDAAGNIINDQEDAAAQAIAFLNQSKNLNDQIAVSRKQKATQENQAEIDAQIAVRNAQIKGESDHLKTSLANIAAIKSAEIAAINAAHQARLSNIQQAQQASLQAFTNAQAQAIASAPRVTSASAPGSARSINQFSIQNSLAKVFQNFRFPTISSGSFGTFGGFPGFARGGAVPGSGDSDTVSALLTPGEFIIKKPSVEKYGERFLTSVNEGLLPQQKFAKGGLVGGGADSAGSGSIRLDLSLNGESASAVLDSGADAFIDELKSAGLVAS